VRIVYGRIDNYPAYNLIVILAVQPITLNNYVVNGTI
jgi:hypothetical protein